MNITGIPRLFVSVMLLLLLCGCAGTGEITGRFNLDLRPEDKRTDIYWPQAPEVPRYLYLGELIGEQNFAPDKAVNSAESLFMWIAGVFAEHRVVDLRRPTHGAVGENGRIYVVDAGRSAVVVFDVIVPVEDKPENKDKEKKDLGQMLLWEKAGVTTNFIAPIAVAIAWDGDVAVSDAKLGYVVRLNNKGEPVGKLGAGELKRPTGIAFDREHGLLFVADTEANDIKVFDVTGKLVNTIGRHGEGEGEFNAPTHLAMAYGSYGGHLHVSDSLNTRIQVFDTDGRYIRSFGQRGINVGDLVRPKGVAVSEDGIVYVIESYFAHLLIYNEQNELLLGITGSGIEGGNFRLPSGVWVDNQGRIFVADMFNGRVVVYQFLGDDRD